MRGPYSKTQTVGSNPPRKELTRTWYRTDLGQKIRTPLPYIFSSGERNHDAFSVASAYPVSSVRYLTQPSNNAVLERVRARVHNKAYAKWVDKVKDGVQLGTDVAEGKQTIDMIRKIFYALRNKTESAQKFLRKGALPANVSSGWLAYHFGIDPLYKELHELMELLEKGVRKSRVVTASAKETFTEVISGSGEKQTRVYRVSVRHTAGVVLVNENFASLSALGLTNPAAIAWELVPFSFVIDWLYPVATYLSYLDDTLGFSLNNPYTTTFVTLNHEVTRTWPVIYPSDPGANRLQTHKGISLVRSLGTPAPVVQRSLNPWSTSLTRALTALSLVVQAGRHTSVAKILDPRVLKQTTVKAWKKRHVYTD